MAYVQPGLYTHYKGGTYLVLFTARDWTNAREGNEVVVYVALANNKIFVRDVPEFTEEISWPDGNKRPRFVFQGTA